MVALVATIHDFLVGAERHGWQKKTWMVGTRPTMTTGWRQRSSEAALLRTSVVTL
jgi:hypothetical protein